MLDDLPADISSWTQKEISAAVTARKVERKRLDVELSFLFTRQNELQPIARLHDDILAAIFAQHQADVPLTGPPKRIQTCTESPPIPLPQWARLGMVCRRWRNVLLSYPLLWTQISTTSSQWLDLSITRSA